MCTHNTDNYVPFRSLCTSYKRKYCRSTSKPSKLQIYRLTSRRRCEIKEEKREMEVKNLKLYLENQSIIEENLKLRKKANLLHQENLALMSQFQNKFSHFDRFSTTRFLLLHI
ncbi:hypothetical protein LWI28_026963 [Acer negundo]|uniref:Uncharacterized protein n=1 Tax=Acer negundo TaxID=4023 RepID=A0AAD5IXN1_ACENE|nr:hypothetical protein LWI28_026963 [Acer negundo]KAK4843065.1 hypothetical protein QYF36_003492 [Acer negundo]